MLCKPATVYLQRTSHVHENSLVIYQQASLNIQDFLRSLHFKIIRLALCYCYNIDWSLFFSGVLRPWEVTKFSRMACGPFRPLMSCKHLLPCHDTKISLYFKIILLIVLERFEHMIVLKIMIFLTPYWMRLCTADLGP